MPAPRASLPGDEFIGRSAELEAVARAFDEGAWLVTVTGMAGIGKTRLAIEHLALRRRRAPTGVDACLVHLARAGDREALLTAVADAVDVPLPTDRTAEEHLGAALDARGDILVILDNAEQIAEHVADILGAWRCLAPAARFLVTSRIPLAIAGEKRIALEPLEPSEGRTLFCTRARAVDFNFGPGATDPHLDAVLSRLDGIPLAIELAAARASSMSMESLARRLDQSLSLLRSNRRDIEPRQATLEAAIDGSWQLLGPAERSALAQCSVFRSSFGLDDAEAIVIPGDDVDVVDAIQSLCDQSLLRRERRDDGSIWLRLAEPVRELAAARLRTLDESDATGTRHATYFATMVGPLVDTNARYRTEHAALFARASAATEDLAAAMDQARPGHPALAARIGLALANVLHLRGARQRCIRAATEALAATRRAGDRELEGRAHLARASHLSHWGGGEDPSADLDAALARARELGLDDLEAQARQQRGLLLLLDRGRREQACAELQRALDLQRRTGDVLGAGITLEVLAMSRALAGRYREAIALHGEALENHERAGNRRWEGVTVRNGAYSHHQSGDTARALRDTQRALAINTELRDPHAMITVCNAVELAAQLGDLGLARAHAEVALARARSGESTPRLGDPFAMRAIVCVLEGDLAAAEALLDESMAWHEPYGHAARQHVAALSRGIIRLLRGRVDAACADLDAALALARPIGDIVTDTCLAAGFLAVAEARRGHPGRSWPLFELARREAARWPENQRFARTLRALESCLAGAPLETTHAPYFEESAARMLALTCSGITADARTLVVAPDLGWLAPPGAAAVDLRRKPVLRRLLRVLVQARRDRPGEPLSTGALIRAVWPGDRSARAALENRLWVALSAARKLGLDACILKDSRGYLLDPGLTVQERAEVVIAAPRAAQAR